MTAAFILALRRDKVLQALQQGASLEPSSDATREALASATAFSSGAVVFQPGRVGSHQTLSSPSGRQNQSEPIRTNQVIRTNQNQSSRQDQSEPIRSAVSI